MIERAAARKTIYSVIFVVPINTLEADNWAIGYSAREDIAWPLAGYPAAEATHNTLLAAQKAYL